MTHVDEQPVWADPELFPSKPPEFAYGAVSRTGRRSGFETFEALDAHVRSSRESVSAVWTPEAIRTVPPESVPELLEALRRRYLDQAEADRSDARRISAIFGFLLAWALYAAVANHRLPQDSAEVGLAAVLLLVLGLIPWYDAWKGRKEAWELDPERLASEEEEARFERWLEHQRATATRGLLGLLVLVGTVQIWVGRDVWEALVALDKGAYRQGEWWRLFTAPFVHGHPLHWALNAAGLWYLGRRVEALARWPHVMIVFLFAVLAGGIASARYLPGQSSVGASGGLLGLLGFLLVFETLHARLVPQPARRRLFAALVLTFLIGAVGYQFIDNFAHAGGVAAGVLYAVLVFPKSRTARRPKSDWRDRLLGVLAAAVLTAASLLTVWRMFTG